MKNYIKRLIIPVIALLAVLATSLASPASGEERRPQESLVYIIPIRGEIDRAMMAFVKRGVGEAMQAGAETVIFEIDTPGGRVDSALEITTLIGSLEEAVTVAYVPADAESTGISWSAGALISFACDRIYMAPGTSMGAAAPVYQTPEGMMMAPEKVVSAVRGQMASLAEKNGYPPGVALAMVDEDVRLLEIEIDGETRAVTEEEYESLERSADPDHMPVIIRTIVDEGKLLTLTAGDALRYHVSSGTVSNINRLMEDLGIDDPEVVRLEKSWADRLVGFITNSAVTGLLLMAGLIALYMEVTSPGFGVPGTIAIIAFAVLFVAQGLLGNVGSLEILLILTGLILIILEIFIIPGFGVPGVAGILLLLVSLVLIQQPFHWPKFEWQWAILYWNLLMVSLFSVLSFISIGVLSYFLPQIPLFRRITQPYELSSEAGYVVQSADETTRLVGKRGTAVTALRPSGKAEIDDEVIPVETDGDFIDSGQCVKVVEVSGNRIIVRKC